MDPEALEPFGEALLAYYHGDLSAQLIIRRDDGYEGIIPVSHFFRPPAEFSDLEIAALKHCRGHVIDIGAGSGLHSLYLQSNDLVVTAIDLNKQAVEVMTQRGIKKVIYQSVFDIPAATFDTLLMLGHGLGVVENLTGLHRFLDQAHHLTSGTGQILLHSRDVRQTDNPLHQAYHKMNLQMGRYIGEIHFQFEFEGQAGPFCSWLHIDQGTLSQAASAAGWSCKTIIEQQTAKIFLG
jgi:SAM-dependent methyltransferase